MQKLLFLIDRNIPNLTGGPHFDFQPYHYGPFDKAVYEGLDELSTNGLVDVVFQNSWRSYRLTVQGQQQGNEFLATLPDKAQVYIHRVSEFVRRLGFAQLVSAIYHAYPEMRKNSVFQE